VQSGNVVSELEFGLVVADTEPVKVGAYLRYDAADPYAVCVSFEAGGDERIEWTFARELLDQGLWEETGDGDVKVWPRGGSVFLALCSPSGRAVLETPRAAIADFVGRTRRMVPVGKESDFIDVDAELAALLP